MWVVIVMIIIFVIMGIIFSAGRGGFLIAGYNTANKKEKEKYDEKKLNHCFAILCFILAGALGITAYVDTDEFATKFLVPIIFILILFILIASNTYCKKK